MFFELCQMSLYDLFFKKEGRFEEKDIASIVKQLLLAINHCHERGIVHRDIKLENILINETDQGYKVKLIDFGISTHFNG